MRRTFALGVVLALAVGTAAQGTVARTSPQPTSDEFDVRAAAPGIGPTVAQVRGITALVRAHPDARLEWNARFGTPSSIIRYGKALSVARGGTPAAAAKTWLVENAAVFGWNAADVAALSVEKTLAQPAGGARIVLLHQVFGGLHGGSLGGSVVIALDRSNRVLSVRANVTRTARIASPSRVNSLRALEIAAGGAKGFRRIGKRAGDWIEYSRGPLAADHYVHAVAFPIGKEPARRAWEVILVRKLWQGYRTVVDATTGEILYRHQMVQFDAPEGGVFDYYPGAPKGGTQQMRSFSGDPQASPQGWLSVVPGLDGPTTFGNNASTATNWFVYTAPDGPGQIRPVSPTGVFDYAFSDAWQSSKCGENPITTTTDPTSEQPLAAPDTPTYALDALPAVTNLFYHHNLMHDRFYKLGFTEEAGANQVSNFGKTDPSLENDPLIGLVQAGAAAGDAPAYLGRDNAYMFPLPDGLPQWSGMFLWEPITGSFIAPCVDGDFSADVIYHEFTHGVTSRWVGAEFGNIDSFHGGAMGEAWSDFYALHYLHESGFETKDILGLYVTPDKISGIRNWALGSVPVGLGDIGYDMTGEEVHADGEIWAGALWDLRTALKAAHPGGAALAAQLVADAMPISGPVPSMVDMRNAILTADVARTKGANQGLIWRVFAQHGMGVSASSNTAFDVNPVPGFDVPDASRNGTVEGRIVDASTGAPLAGVRILISEFEARVSPVKRSATDGSFSIKLQAGTYPVTIQAPGYGTRTFELNVHAGEIVSRRVALGINYASTYAGAKIASSTNDATLGPPIDAIDDTAQTSWWTDGDADGPNRESFVVDLAGSAPVKINGFRVSAYNTPGGSRFEALKNVVVSSSLDGKTFTKIATDSIGASPVRPKAPDLNYRFIKLHGFVSARFVKVEASPQDAAAGGVSIGEFQIFGTGDSVKVTPPLIDASKVFHDEGRIVVPSPAVNLTEAIMSADPALCIAPPPTQGIDAWVSELPDGFGDGNHLVDVGWVPLLPDPRPDIDLFFLGPDCTEVGSIATTAYREVGSIPQGAKYLVTSLFTALPGSLTVDAKPAIGAIPKAPKPPVVRGGTTLPGTGVPSALRLGLGLLTASGAAGFALARPRARRQTRL